MAHTQYVQCTMFQHTTAPQWEHFWKDMLALTLNNILSPQNMQGQKCTSLSIEAAEMRNMIYRSIEPNTCRVIRYGVSICLMCYCQWWYNDNVDNQTSKAVQGTIAKPPTVSQEFVFKQSKNTDTHMRCSLMNIAEQQAITHTSFISPVLFLLIAHVQLQTLPHGQTNTHMCTCTHISSHIVTKSHMLAQTYAPSHFLFVTLC